jgi:predicted XRE-type DNA-binding protein
MKKNKDYTVSSGNVFADLGLTNPAEELTKAELARQINAIIKQQDLTQAAAAGLLDVDQPKISALSKGKLFGFSLERLFRFLNILDQDITIKVSPKTKSKKRASVAVTVPKPRRQPAARKQSNAISLSIQARKKK